MNTLRTLQLVGAIAKVVCGLSGAGIGIYETKSILDTIGTAKLNDTNSEIETDDETVTVEF